jgi:hypothetical protein
MLFTMLVIQVPPSERHDWPKIRAWAAELPVGSNRHERFQ